MSCKAIKEIRLRELTVEQRSIMAEWVKDRPQIIQDRAAQLPPNSGLVFDDGTIGYVFSYQEDGGITFSHHHEYEDAKNCRQCICGECLDEALARCSPPRTFEQLFRSMTPSRPLLADLSP